ncbi:MAG TPA: glycosyltransferase family 4 protein [Chloroflexia bacterium]|nr:glycosyltransferase family 4 protein [Chloroflexia bacterium]
MRLLYVSGSYMPASGGAELSMYTILRYLAGLGHHIVVVTRALDGDVDYDDQGDSGITVTRIAAVEALEAALAQIKGQHLKIEAIITQNLWCDLAILWGRRHNIPVIYFLRSPSGSLDVSVGGQYECRYVLGNSATTVAYLAEHWGRHDARLVPPMVDAGWYRVHSNSREFITMVNPIVTKGGGIFRQIAERMPERRFLAVEGWGHLKKEGRWDTERFQDLARGYGEEAHLPEEVVLSDLPNVVKHPTVADMRAIYSRTRLLLIPSIVPEAAPRVALEAMINGIPVIGSGAGGTAEVVGGGGEIIEDYCNVVSWLAAIRRFDDPAYYEMRAQRAREQAAGQDNPSKMEPLLEILAEIEAAGREA